jgi:hypothetical protein
LPPSHPAWHENLTPWVTGVFSALHPGLHPNRRAGSTTIPCHRGANSLRTNPVVGASFLWSDSATFLWSDSATFLGGGWARKEGDDIQIVR